MLEKDREKTSDGANLKKPNKKSWMERLFKVVFYTIASILIINLLLYILLSIPAVQDKLTSIVVKELKSKLNTEISVDRLRLSLFNNVSLHGVYIEDQNKDTLLYVDRLGAKLDTWKLLKSELSVTSISLDDFVINVTQKDSISDFNFQFIIDAFASDTTTSDTTTSSFNVIIQDIDIRRGRLNYDVLSEPQTPGIFNASHIKLTNFEANLDLNSIAPTLLDISLNKLSANEQSGLAIKNLSTRVYSDQKRYWAEDLTLQLPTSILSLATASYDMDSESFSLKTKEALIAPRDIFPLMEELKYLSENITLETDISGKLPLVDIKTFNLNYGSEAFLSANANMSNALNYKYSDITLSIDKFRASPKAIRSFAQIGDSSFVLPDILQKVGNISLKGQLKGTLNKIDLNLESWIRQGAITLSAKGGIDTTFTNYQIDAKLNTQNFNLGNLLGNDSTLGRTSIHIDLTASQKGNNNLSAQVKGAIDMIQYEKNNIRNIPFSGYYNPKEMGFAINADLPVGALKAKASMTQAQIPDIQFSLALDTLHVNRFYQNAKWINPLLSFRLNGELKGLDIDNITGKINLDSLNLHDKNFVFEPGKITFIAGQSNEDKYIFLNSQLISAGISGKYQFTTLADELNNMMNSYLSAVFPTRTNIKKYENFFSFNLKIQNTEQLTSILGLPFSVVEAGEIDGHIDAIDKEMDIKASFPHIRINDKDIRDIKADISNRDSAFHIQASSNLPMNKGYYSVALNINGANNSLHGLLNLNNSETTVDLNGKLETLAHFILDDKKRLVSTLNTLSSEINIDKLRLSVLPANIINKGETTTIENFGIGLGNKRYFGMDGTLSDQSTDTLKIYFDQAQIGDFLSAFEIDHIKTVLDGEIFIAAPLGKPELYTNNFKMKDIVVFSDTLGTLKLQSQWNDASGAVNINSTLTQQGKDYAHIKGTVYTRQDSMNIIVRMDRFPINWLSPFMVGTLNKLTGSISSDITAIGKINSPKTKGFLGFNDVNIGIDYTNVAYHISDTINVSPDRIGFSNLTLRDQQNNEAKVNASLTHQNFKNMKYSLDMKMNNLMALNTESRTDSLFFGRVFASGSVRISGDENDINMNMNISNGKNSIINISIPQKSEAVDYKSIVYINVPPEKLEIEKAQIIPTQAPLPLNLNANINLDPNIALRVVIDPSTGDVMQVKGSGKIVFSYNMQTEEMKTFGDYTISEGNVKVSLQNLKTLEFRVRDGSRLSFVGDPLKTRFDIIAYRRVRADLQTLDPSFSLDGSANRVIVDCVLGIKGDMNKMDLTYNVELPDADDDTKRKLQTLISTDEQKIRQFAYLVATNSFYSSSGGGSITDGVWTSLASSTLSNGLNAIFGNILGDKWQIGTNIESNGGSFSDMDMSLSVSTKLFDDKLKLNTNVGYRTDQTSTNSFIGDFEAEYALSPVWTLKAYNHTNNKFYKQAPLTQGIGIVYTKEARTLKLLFQSFKPKRKAPQETTEPKQADKENNQDVPNTEK